MDLASHALTERGVHHLVARQRPLAGECRRNDQRVEMRIVVAADVHLRGGQSLADEAFNIGGGQRHAPEGLALNAWAIYIQA